MKGENDSSLKLFGLQKSGHIKVFYPRELGPARPKLDREAPEGNIATERWLFRIGICKDAHNFYTTLETLK
jgi:hypothetical protein